MTKEELLQLCVPDCSEADYAAVKSHWNHVAKPLDGLGVLEEHLCRIGAAQQQEIPQIKPRALVIMCADNGVVEEGISQSGQDVTLAVAKNMGRLQTSACRMAACCDTKVIPVDIGINTEEKITGVLDRKVIPGTRNFRKEPAMTEEELVRAIGTGIEIVRECREQGYCMLATGEMGIGNTTTSAAVAAAVLDLPAEVITGRGSGLSDLALQKKKDVIRTALEQYGFLQESVNPETGRKSPQQVFEILRCVGGLDIAGLCGVFIGGALYRVPVVIDGVISAAAALCAEYMLPGTNRFMLASHKGAEPAIEAILKALDLTAVIHAGLKLGEGTGALLLFPMLDMAMEVYRESSSFAEIGVDQYQRQN